MTERLRAVLDTNVFVSAFLSRSPSSPTREVLQRWEAGEFTLLISTALLEEIAEKLAASGIQPNRIAEFLTLLSSLAQPVEVPPESVEAVVAADPDDDSVLACAVLGMAQYLVTYDAHFDSLGGEYAGVKIVKALPFLWALRGNAPV